MAAGIPLHSVYISLGSNIDPQKNIVRALHFLRQEGEIINLSQIWETQAVGSNGPNFLNAALLYRSPYTRYPLKDCVLHPIEGRLGRVRTADKNAPRPMDLDIIIFDDEVVETDLWTRLYIARPFAELLPDLINPQTGKSLRATADELQRSEVAVLHPEIVLK